jgi:hypothetical protein
MPIALRIRLTRRDRGCVQMHGYDDAGELEHLVSRVYPDGNDSIQCL